MRFNLENKTKMEELEEESHLQLSSNINKQY